MVLLQQYILAFMKFTYIFIFEKLDSSYALTLVADGKTWPDKNGT